MSDSQAKRADKWRFAEGDPIAPEVLALRLLGGGERYETYLAYDERRLALVVVKIIRPELVADPHSLRGLAREVELLQRLAHPVIVRLFGSELEGDRPRVVLEHLEGPRLSSLLRRYGPLDPEQLLPLGAQLASAAHYMASEGVVHLDIKPSNTIMGAPARLIDLSIARTPEDLAGRDHAIGTDAYMAPEQCDPAGRGPITPAADVWGIGATLHHAALGRATFVVESGARRRGDAPEAGEVALDERREGEAADRPQSPDAQVPGSPDANATRTPEARYPQLVRAPEPLPLRLPEPLRDLIMSCLAADPDERPSAAEVTARFEEMVGALPHRPVLRRFRVRPR